MGFRQAVANALGLSVREEEGPSDGAAVRPPARPAITITPEGALSIADVFRAVQIHQTAAAQLSVDVLDFGRPIPPPSLIQRPDLSMTRRAFIGANVVSMATTGNAFWLKERASNNAVRNCRLLNPHLVTVRELKDHSVRYWYENKEYGPRDIQHLQFLRVPGRIAGLGPIQAGQAELAGVQDLRDFAGGWFRDGQAQPNGLLTTDQPITAKQAKDYKQVWNETADGGVRVIGSGLNYSPILLKPADAQWLDARRFNTTQTARLMAVPASLMLASVEGTSTTYANVEQEWIGYVRFALMVYLLEIEDAFSEVLPTGQEARFNVDALLRTDTKTRYEAHEIALRAGFKRKSEVRADENLPAIPGIDDEPAPTAPAKEAN